MKKGVLLLSNRNLFSVFFHHFVSEKYRSFLLNVRYPNETLTKEEHFIQQLQDVYHEKLHQNGLAASPYLFRMNENLFHRINEIVQYEKPNLIIFEMVTFDESEWQLIKTLKNEFSIPMIIYVKNEESAHAIMGRLLKLGIREIAITIERDRILNIVERNLRNPF